MIDKIKKVIKPANRKEANVEAEKGESIVTYLFGISIPEHYKIEGKKHEQGGTPLKVPDGSFVFSDDKKMIVDDPNILKFFGESKPKTPAQIAKKYELNEYKANLIDTNADQISKITSALMLKNNYEKLAQLALYQEAKKGFKDGVPTFAEDYLLSIGVEPKQLIEAVKGKMEEKIYKNTNVDEQGNPVMEEGGDPTNPYDKNKIIQEKKALFDKWIEDFKNGRTEFSLGNINPNLNKQVYEAFLDYAKSKGLNVEDVNFVSKNPNPQNTIGYSTKSFIGNGNNQQPVKDESEQNIPKELEFNIEDVNKRLESQPTEEVNLPPSNSNSTNNKKFTGVIEEPVDNKPVLQNTTEPKGNTVDEKRKWLQSKEGKKWLESEWGKQWLESSDGKKYKQELRYNKLSSIANSLLPNQPVEITLGGMDGIGNLTMMATEASKWNLGKPRSQQFSADNVFQPVKGIDRGDYSAAGSTYGQFRPNEQTPKYTEAIPYQEGGGVKDGEEPKPRWNKDDEVSLQQLSKVLTERNKDKEWVDRAINYDRSLTPIPDENNPGYYSTHLLGYSSDDKGNYIIYPMIVRQGDKLVKFNNPDEAYKYAMDNKQYIVTNSKDLAEYYTERGFRGFKESTGIEDKVKEHVGELEKQGYYEDNKKMNFIDKIKNYLRNKMDEGGEPKNDNKSSNYLQVPDNTDYMRWLANTKNNSENSGSYSVSDNKNRLTAIYSDVHLGSLDPRNINKNIDSYFKNKNDGIEITSKVNPSNEVEIQTKPNTFEKGFRYSTDWQNLKLDKDKSQEQSNTEEQNKVEEQYKPKIGRKYYTQDIRNIAAALGQLAGVKMYLPWSAPIDYMVPRAVYYDPTREIQGAATVANTQGKLMQAYLSPQSAMANMGEQQARLAEQTANMVANAQQRNIGVANQMEQQKAGIYNQAANMERARQQELYNQTVTARQQYDNSRRKALAGYIAALNQADENAARAYNLSNIVFADSPFYIDPATGQIEIDKSRVKLDKNKTPDKPLEEKIKESYKMYKESSIPDNIIADIIERQYFGSSGKSTKERDDKETESEKTIKRQAKGIYNASSKSTASKSSSEEDDSEEKKYGGEVKTIISFLKSKYLS